MHKTAPRRFSKIFKYFLFSPFSTGYNFLKSVILRTEVTSSQKFLSLIATTFKHPSKNA